MGKRGRKPTKYGRRVSFYLSNEAIFRLINMAKGTGGNKSKCIENLIHTAFVNNQDKEKIVADIIEKEIRGVL